jgi:uncharacterized paraquat-inducible protein A
MGGGRFHHQSQTGHNLRCNNVRIFRMQQCPTCGTNLDFSSVNHREALVCQKCGTHLRAIRAALCPRTGLDVIDFGTRPVTLVVV